MLLNIMGCNHSKSGNCKICNSIPLKEKVSFTEQNISFIYKGY